VVSAIVLLVVVVVVVVVVSMSALLCSLLHTCRLSVFHSINREAQVSEGVLNNLIPYVTSVNQALERIFGGEGLIVETADHNHLTDFEHYLSALIQEAHWYLDMGKISQNNEPQVRSGLGLVEDALKRKPNPNLVTCVSGWGLVGS